MSNEEFIELFISQASSQSRTSIDGDNICAVAIDPQFLDTWSDVANGVDHETNAGMSYAQRDNRDLLDFSEKEPKPRDSVGQQHTPSRGPAAAFMSFSVEPRRRDLYYTVSPTKFQAKGRPGESLVRRRKIFYGL
jgi:hypothetical protein